MDEVAFIKGINREHRRKKLFNGRELSNCGWKEQRAAVAVMDGYIEVQRRKRTWSMNAAGIRLYRIEAG